MSSKRPTAEGQATQSKKHVRIFHAIKDPNQPLYVTSDCQLILHKSGLMLMAAVNVSSLRARMRHFVYRKTYFAADQYFFYQLTSTDQIVITKLVSAVDAATNFLHWLLSPAIS